MNRGRDDGPSDPVRIDRVIGETMAKTSRSGGALISVIEKWKQLVSETTLEHARPTSIRKGVLLVTVTDPVWSSELTYFLPDFLDAINQVMPQKSQLKEIRLRVGQLPPMESTGSPATPPDPAEVPSHLPAEIRERIDKVEDPALRKLMIRVASKTPRDEGNAKKRRK